MKTEKIERNFIQELFFRARDGMLKQNDKCEISGHTAFFHDGLACGYGHLIDKKYWAKSYIPSNKQIMASNNLTTEEFLSIRVPLTILKSGLIYIHDRFEPDDWPEHLDNLQRRLNIPDLETIK